MSQHTRQLSRYSTQELAAQQLVALPSRDLMLAVTVLGIPVVGVHGISVSIS